MSEIDEKLSNSLILVEFNRYYEDETIIARNQNNCCGGSIQ
jgi:hypothetical protein